MKTIINLIIIGAIIPAMCLSIGCGSSGSETPAIRVLTSNDFADDPSLVAQNEDTVVVFLGANEASADVSKQAEDADASIPYYNSETYTHTFCWDEDAGGSGHYVVLVDEGGGEVLTLHTGECVTQTIEQGNYSIDFYHDGVSDATTVFLNPLEVGEESSAEADAAYPMVQARQQDVWRLLQTNSCGNCDLRNANLRNAHLSNAYLANANLQDAYLNDATLDGANMENANLSGTHFDSASLRGANMRYANATETHFDYADLTEANLWKAVAHWPCTTHYDHAILCHTTKPDGRTDNSGCR